MKILNYLWYLVNIHALVDLNRTPLLKKIIVDIQENELVTIFIMIAIFWNIAEYYNGAFTTQTLLVTFSFIGGAGIASTVYTTFKYKREDHEKQS